MQAIRDRYSGYSGCPGQACHRPSYSGRTPALHPVSQDSPAELDAACSWKHWLTRISTKQRPKYVILVFPIPSINAKSLTHCSDWLQNPSQPRSSHCVQCVMKDSMPIIILKALIRMTMRDRRKWGLYERWIASYLSYLMLTPAIESAFITLRDVKAGFVYHAISAGQSLRRKPESITPAARPGLANPPLLLCTCNYSHHIHNGLGAVPIG